MIKTNKNMKVNAFLFGDFDKDGVKNIDDYYPYDPKRSYPSIYKNPEFYHKTRLSGTEVTLSSVLLKIQRENEKQARHLRRFLKTHPNSKGRVKTVASTINKLYKKCYDEKVHDVVGARITTRTRRGARITRGKIKKKYKTDPTRFKDFYKTPKGKVHYALHMGLITGEKKKDGGKIPKVMELQIQSGKMEELSLKMHEHYKMGKSLKEFEPVAKSYFLMGF